jgi:hypothetical protein
LLSTTLSLQAAPTFSNYGDSVTLTATLSPYSATGITTNGETVNFMSGSISLGSGTLSGGMATLTTTAIPAGPNSLTAAYAPGALDQVFLPSTSLPLSFTVKSPPYLTTSSLTFDNTGVGVTSTAQTTTLTNYSGATVSLKGIVAPNTNWVVGGTCTASLVNNGTCDISVSFNPQSKGPNPATINVLAGTLQLPLTLTGTGVPPLYLSAATLAFGTVGQSIKNTIATCFVPCTPPPNVVKVYNYTGTTAAISASTVTSTYSADFVADTNNCNSVPTGSSCPLGVSFTPSILGAETATITVSTGANTATLAVTGAGAIPLSVSPPRCPSVWGAWVCNPRQRRSQ